MSIKNHMDGKITVLATQSVEKIAASVFSWNLLPERSMGRVAYKYLSII